MNCSQDTTLLRLPEGIDRNMTRVESRIVSSDRRTDVVAATIVIGSFVILYRSVLYKLVCDWIKDGNYSHGFFILPLALYFAWKKRDKFAQAETNPSSSGLILLIFSIATLLAGILGSELFLTRVSMLGTIAGMIVFIYGWSYLKISALPILTLLLMIPIPAIVFNQIAFPLQMIASRFGELVLSFMGIPVLREGNIIHLANTSLEVVEACSGIRSLISLLTLSIVYGYFADRRIYTRIALAIATVPIAVVSNGLRVSMTGVAAYYYGPQAAEGFIHGFSGWVLFVFAFIMLFATQRLIGWVAAIHPNEEIFKERRD
jgi:exosortase